MAGPEKRIESSFVTWCKENLGLKVRKLKDMGEQGFPDRSIILPGGRIVCIEFKSPTGDLEPSQKIRIPELRALGVPVLVTSSKKEAIEWLLNLMTQLGCVSPNSGSRTNTKGKA